MTSTVAKSMAVAAGGWLLTGGDSPLVAAGPRRHHLVLGAGEAAEFGAPVQHLFGSTGDEPAEILSMFAPQGERGQARARTTGKRGHGMRRV